MTPTTMWPGVTGRKPIGWEKPLRDEVTKRITIDPPAVTVLQDDYWMLVSHLDAVRLQVAALHDTWETLALEHEAIVDEARAQCPESEWSQVSALLSKLTGYDAAAIAMAALVEELDNQQHLKSS